MGGNLTPTLMWELSNLDKDANSQELLMKSPKSYLKDFDTEGIPQDLSQIFEAKAAGSLSGEHVISICEEVAQDYGPNIVSYIDNIMSTMINSLMTSSESFSLQEACSRVVLVIARYGIDPLTPAEKKKTIINSICKPLSDSLLGSKESLACGAALCLLALFDSDNWAYASEEIVNEICLNVAGALEEKPTQTSAHMCVVMALARHNSPILEPYARSLIRSGLQILNIGIIECNSQKQLSAIRMLNFLMKFVDARSIFSELETVIEGMEKCESDVEQMSHVKHAASEALQTARNLIWDKFSRFEKDSSSKTCLNLVGGAGSRWKIARDRSPVSLSSELGSVHSIIECESLPKSPMSPEQLSSNFDCRKHWKNKISSDDVKLRDGLYTDRGLGSNWSKTHFEHFEDDGISNNGRDRLDAFSGYAHARPRDRVTRSATPIPERPHYQQVNVNDIDILATPRKFICSVPNPSAVSSNYSEKQTRRIRSRASRKLEQILAREVDGNCQNKFNHDRNPESRNQAPESESVSSTGDVASNGVAEEAHYTGSQLKIKIQSPNINNRSFVKVLLNLVCFIFIIFSVVTFLVIWVDDQQVGFDLAPT